MKTYALPCGKETETVSLDETHVLYDLHGRKTAAVTDETAAIRQALRAPVGSAPLRELVRPGETVAIVVSDITRLVHTAQMLPVIVDELNAAGVADRDITVVIAQGTHRAHTPEEDVIVCGEEMVRRLRIVQHDCFHKENQSYVGKTSCGNDVYFDRAVVAADKVILTGAVSFHPMAGFGGGRKALLPGVAGYDTIMYNHSLALTETVGGGCNPACETSLLTCNPLHQDMYEAAALLEPTFLVNTVFTADGDLYEVVGGHWHEAWKKGCDDLLAISSVPITQQADIIIGSAGGYPKDMNLYQSMKAHMNAVFAAKPGGIMIFTLDCPDIKEPAIFTDWFFRSDMDAFERDLRADFTIPAFVAFKSRGIINSMKRVYVVTRPENHDIIRQSGQIPAHSLQEAWEDAVKEIGKTDYTVTIMGHAAATFPVLTET
ncbi:nickel-dependent lactate racemase [Megasphaera vaginalis (ex Bordigoni et al. 2020)]|uniref:nickel-dependent lactate racemase n=1 Tax=Megasphaera vaginalis (ex Bordigoni et al. 2020) TaxID=2045301 RepID=UPI000C7BAD2C|nr:nickel-dependent lactate racemase [Megasphaera vaginalis (ex Bordigoni et al. 2020)]